MNLFMQTLYRLLAVFLFIILLPVILAIWMLIKLGSSNTAVFRQQRVGLNREEFSLLKFRTMKPNTIEAATHLVDSNQITAFGSWLRKYKLDEILQILNVLKGEMELVGPRPCLPNQLELINARISRGIFNIKPGITGLAQVVGVDMSTSDLLAKIDYLYCSRKSLFFDVQIILATFGLGRQRLRQLVEKETEIKI